MQPFFLLEKAFLKKEVRFERNYSPKTKTRAKPCELYLPDYSLVIRVYDKEFKADKVKYQSYLAELANIGLNVMIITLSIQPYLLSHLDEFLEASKILQGERWPMGTQRVMDDCLLEVNKKVRLWFESEVFGDNIELG